MNDIGLCTQDQTADEAQMASALSRELASFMPCRFSPKPFRIPERTAADLRRLGPTLLSFYRAQNAIYMESVNGQAPDWIAAYLDNGKPEEIVRLGREKAFCRALPSIIRPDILVCDGKFSICELDSVPGGFGLAARLAECYQRHGDGVLGDVSVEDGFRRAVVGEPSNPNDTLIIVVSDESADYLDEMNWLAARLRDFGHPVHVAHPRDMIYSEEGATFSHGHITVRASVIYRFLELFDYRQISKWDLLIYLAKAKRVGLTPPPKAYLEEKLWFALFHHPTLEAHWRRHLQIEDIDLLRAVIPPTWVMDPAPVPPHATIPNLHVGGKPIQSWNSLRDATQAERRMVIKPSGFSAQAWGGRGVIIGHDVARDEWGNAVEKALASFSTTTSILQTYMDPDQCEMTAADPRGNIIQRVAGRVRMNPYYFVINGEAVMSNVLVTHCTKEKKKIHGMRDAIMTVCST